MILDNNKAQEYNDNMKKDNILHNHSFSSVHSVD